MRLVSSPDYLLCCDCETPCYTFEWREGEVDEAVCLVCGNDDESTFLTEEQWEAYADSGSWEHNAPSP